MMKAMIDPPHEPTKPDNQTECTRGNWSTVIIKEDAQELWSILVRNGYEVVAEAVRDKSTKLIHYILKFRSAEV